MLLHPLYVELQDKSPMGMMRDYDIKEVDESIGSHEFYKDYMSQSLPLIVRKGCLYWPIKQLVQEDSGLKNLFTATISEDFGFLMMSPNMTETDMENHLSSKGIDTTMQTDKKMEITRLVKKPEDIFK